MSEMTQEQYDGLKMNWAVQNGGTSPDSVAAKAGYVYNLFNITLKKVLCYQSRWGNAINLGWAAPGQAFYVRLTKQNGSEGPIVFGEPIALSVVSGGYIQYQEGRRGINLGWAATPVFQWSFVGQPEGETVRIGSVVALHNSRTNDCLFYEERTFGINLKWVRDTGKFGDWVKVENVISGAAAAYREAKSYF